MKRREALKTAGVILGFSITAGTATAVLNGCSADPTPGWTPNFLTDDEVSVIKSMSNVIIPGTDSKPGAKDIMMEKFFDERLSIFGSEEEKTKFKEGVAGILENEPFNGNSSTMEKMNEEDLLSYIQSELEEEDEIMTELYEMMVVGFCTSEKGMKEVLVYESVPGEQKGCIPFEEVGGIWAL